MTTTVREFVEILGGNDKAARRFGVTAPAICNWKRDNRFPAWVLPKVAEVAAEFRVVLPARALKTKRPAGAIRVSASAAE